MAGGFLSFLASDLFGSSSEDGESWGSDFFKSLGMWIGLILGGTIVLLVGGKLLLNWVSS